jgi:hypothetical protein
MDMAADPVIGVPCVQFYKPDTGSLYSAISQTPEQIHILTASERSMFTATGNYLAQYAPRPRNRQMAP